MNIKSISKSLKDSIDGEQLKISDIVKIVPETNLLSSAFPEALQLSLGNTKVSTSATNNTISVTGSTQWTNQLNINFKLTLEDTEDGSVASVNAALPADYSVNIPGLTWFKLQDSVVMLESIPQSRAGSSQTRGYNHKLACSLIIDETSIPLKATYTGEEGLTLGIGMKAIAFNGLNDMARIVGGSQNLSLPAQIDSLGAVSLHTLELEVSPGSNDDYTIQRIGFGFETTKPWELIPDIFSIDAIDVNAQLYEPLSAQKSFGGGIAGTLKLGKTDALMTAVKENANEPWVFNTLLPKISLSDLAEQALSEFNLNVTLPRVSFVDTALSITPSTGNYSLQSASASDTSWKIPLGVTTLEITGVTLAMAKQDGDLNGSIEGSAELFGATVSVSADLDDELKISISAQNVDLNQIVDDLLQEIDLPDELPNVTFDEIEMTVTPSTKEFSLTATSSEDWEIPLGVAGFLVEDLQFSVKRTKKTAAKFETTGSFKGNAALGPVSFELDCTFPGDLIFTTEIPKLDLSPVIQDLCGPDSLMGLPVPVSVINVSLEDITLTMSPTKKFVSLSSSSALGQSELLITQTKQKKWAFMAAFAPPEQWKFSSIDRSLSVMDGLKFDNTALIVSSAPDALPPISIVDVPQSVTVVKGLTFFASLDMEGLGVDDLMNVQSLTVSTTIGTSIESVMLSAAMEGSFKVHENIALGDMKFFLRPAPTNFQLGISGAVIAKIDDSDLRFVGTMSVRPIERSAAFGATMLGTWNEPFGVKGLSVADVALEVGVGIVPPPAVAMPIVGLAGTIGIGSFDGSAAVKFDAANPNKSMIAASFNQIYLKDVVQTFCEPKVYNSIPKEIRNSVLSAGMEDVEVYVVPQTTTIGELVYESGFRFQGKMSIADFDAQFMFVLDYTSGFAIKATMDPIVIEDVLKITGVGGTPGPSMDIDLRLGGNPHIEIEGLVDLLGVGAMAMISISDEGFAFAVEGKIFDLFSAKVAASGGNIKNGGDFYLLVEMQNDLISYLREHALEGINAAAEEAAQSLTDAQSEIDKAQADVNKLEGEINRVRRTITRERQRDAKSVNNAEKAVTGAQNEVNKLQREIESLRRTVRAERNRDAQNVKSAENAVQSAQNTVNGLQRDIDRMRTTIKAERSRDTESLRSAQKTLANEQKKVNSLQSSINTNKANKAKIKKLNGHIASKTRWYKKSGWKKSYRWAEYSAYCTAKGAEITALYTAIGGLETTMFAAKGTLEIAKQSLRGMEAAANTFPIDADPRILGLFTLKETANVGLEAAKQSLKSLRAVIKSFPIDADPRIAGVFTAKGSAIVTLEAAKQTLKGLQLLIKAFPIDADPRIVGLFTALGGSTAALQGAKLFLEGVKETVGGMADVSSFIVENGLGGLLDIKRARFEGDLNVVKGGSVAMALDLVLLKDKHSFELAFNFNSPTKAIESLVQKLIAEIG